jgi:hypothetical protein
MSDWGQGAKNNNIGWGQGAANNNIGWGNSHKVSWAGDTEIVGTDGAAPVNTVAPTISGTATIGQTLTSTTGTWTSDTGVTGYLYQWYRGATLITGATNNTYVLVLADVAFDITCRVAATDTDGTSAYVSSNAIFLFDVDYKAVLDRGTALSYTLPTLAQQKLQNTLLMNMKTDGVWAKLDVFYNFANNGSQEFGTLNWKSPTTRQSTLIGTPNFISNQGFQGTGTSYISTNYNPALGGPNKYVQNNASRYFYLYQNSVSTNVSFDGGNSASVNGISRANVDSQRINQGSSTLIGIPTNAFDFTAVKGMKSIHRTSSTNVELFNDTTQGSRTATSVALTSGANNTIQFVLRGTSTTVFATHTVSMYAMGESLVSENAAFVADYNTYINAI